MKKTYLSLLMLIALGASAQQSQKNLIKKEKERRQALIENIKSNKPIFDVKEYAKVAHASSSAQKGTSSAARPDSIVNYFWMGNQYQVMGHDIITYLPNMKPLEVIKHVNMGASTLPIEKIVYSYNNDGKITQIDNYEIVGNQHILESRTSLSYDGQGRLNLLKLFIYNNNQVIDILADSIVMISNAQNQVTKYSYYSKFSMNDPYELQLALSGIEYGADGRETKFSLEIDPIGLGFLIVFAEYSQLQWKIAYKPVINLLLNPDALLDMSYEFYTLYPELDEFSEFGPSDFVLSVLQGLGQPLAPASRATSTTANNKVQSILLEEYDGSGWFDSERFLMNYDAAGKITMVTYEENLGTGWDPYYRQLYAYDAKGNWVGEFEQEYMNNVWDTVYGDYNATTYDAQDRIIEKENKSFFMSMGFANNSKHEFFYGPNVGIQENLLSSIKVYPNPAQNKLFIQMEDAFDGSVQLLDLNGRRVYSKDLRMAEGHLFEMELSNYARGTYILSIQNKNGNKNIQRIILK